MAKWNKIGVLMVNKEKKPYIKIAFADPKTKQVTLKEGQFLSMFDPRQGKRKNKETGEMEPLTEQQLARIPEFVKQELFLVEE